MGIGSKGSPHSVSDPFRGRRRRRIKTQANFLKRLQPRLPNIFIAARVLRRYRGRGSLLFILRWTVWHRLRPADEDALPEQLLHSIGIHNPRLDKIAGIYNGLQREQGTIQAARACIEIVRAIDQHES